MTTKIRSKLEVKLVTDKNEVVMDEELASLLILIKREGSLLKATRILGITYSRAWERISKVEKILGKKLITSKRGVKGGALLTDEALKLLSQYLHEYERLTGRSFEVSSGIERKVEVPETLLVTGSHDILLAHLVSRLKERGFFVEVHWIGSLNGIASVMLREGDVAGIHVFDEESNIYNITYFRKLDLAPIANLVRGYERVLGFISREAYDLESILDGLISGKLRLVNRQVGSGTRKVLEWLLRDYVKKKGINFNFIKRAIRGYDNEVNTHIEVGAAIASGEADVGLAIKQVAKAFALNFVPVIWENFDFIILKRSLKKKVVKSFLECLRYEVPKIAKRLDGYKVPENIGEILM